MNLGHAAPGPGNAILRGQPAGQALGNFGELLEGTHHPAAQEFRQGQRNEKYQGKQTQPQGIAFIEPFLERSHGLFQDQFPFRKVPEWIP
jgi:hypothetical protein